MNSKHQHQRPAAVSALPPSLWPSRWRWEMTMPGVAGARGFVRDDFTVAVDLPTASLEPGGTWPCASFPKA